MDHQNQMELERLYNKNQTLSRLRSEFRDPEIIDHCMAVGIPIDFAIDLLCQLVLHKRASASILVGILGPKHFGESASELQACADMLVKAAEHDLCDWYDLHQQFIIKIDVSEDVYEDLDRYQYPLPMVVVPREVTNNRETGFYTSKGSIILKDNHHDDDVCLDHINRLNQVALTINADTARMVQNQWKNHNKKKEGETDSEFAQRVKAFEKYDRSSRDVMEGLFMMGNRLYLTHRYDKRGRTYSQGYHVNPQGNDWNKAVVELADKELVQ